MNTEIGEVQSQVSEAKKEQDEEDSPLKQRIKEFGDNLARLLA